MSNPNAVIHDFHRSLEGSQRLSDEPSWIKFYQAVWPDVLTIVRVDKDSLQQRRGIDRMIWLPNGKQILIDEKNRSRESPYDDIALELVSSGEIIGGSYRVKGKNFKGWAVSDHKHCDYIAYSLPRFRRCYLLPFEILRATVNAEKRGWLNELGVSWDYVGPTRKTAGLTFPVDSMNHGYLTRNIGVSWSILSEAMKRQMDRPIEVPECDLPPADDQGIQLEFQW